MKTLRRERIHTANKCGPTGEPETTSFQPLSILPDVQLAHLYKDGDAAAADVLFERVRKPLSKFIAQYDPKLSSTEIEDAVQGVLMRALNQGFQYDGRNGASLVAFMKTVVKCYFIDQARKGKLILVPITNQLEEINDEPGFGVSEETLVCEKPGPEEIFFAKQHAKAIRECLDAMSIRDRRVLEMYAAEFSLDETASALLHAGLTDRLLTPQGVRYNREKAREKFSVLLATRGINVTP